MNILMVSDSRGSLPSGGWTGKFKSIHPEHNYVFHRSCIELPTISMYDLDPFLNTFSDNYFDLAFLQVGYHEGLEYYTAEIFKQLTKNHFNADALVKPNGNLFLYIDRAAEKRIFDLVKIKSKKVIFIGMHCITRFANGRCADNVQEMNTTFSKLATDYIEIPQDEKWADEHLSGDNIHFNDNGMDYMLRAAETYL